MHLVQGGAPRLAPDGKRIERRRDTRTPIEIRSLDDARRFVQILVERKVENNPAVKAWRTAKQSTWLLLLVVAFLGYYLVTVIAEVLALV